MDRFDRSFQRAQYAYDNATPPEGPEHGLIVTRVEDPRDETCFFVEDEHGDWISPAFTAAANAHQWIENYLIERAEDAAEAAAERRADQAQEDRDNDYDREMW